MSPRKVSSHRRQFVADTLTPVGAYARLAALSPIRFLFESVSGGEQVSRYSFLGAGPREIYRLFSDRVEVERDGESTVLDGDPRDPLKTLRGPLSGFDHEQDDLPFSGGFVGYFGFDTIRLVERLPESPPDPFDLPLAWLGCFDQVVVFDHAQQRVTAVANEVEGEVDRAAAEANLESLSRALTSGGDGGRGGALVLPEELEADDQDGAEDRPGSPSLTGEQYRSAVEAAKRYIDAGDIFQVVLSRRWQLAGAPVEPLALYRAVRLVNPSPYMVLLETPEAALVGASPEMLVRKQGSRIETRPIAGTRPRGADPESDRALGADLLNDEKERAEHLMLVDLGRNDLGKIARVGSVEVTSFMEVERYSHVMHLESSVEAQLEEDRDALDVLLSCFPAGTVSGAPKIRAMEIIAELEPEARGPYAGAVGYLSYGGDLDTCITIRTLVVRDGEITVTAGAGIVADSVPASEERETENKAAALIAAVALARRLEAGGLASESDDRLDPPGSRA